MRETISCKRKCALPLQASQEGNAASRSLRRVDHCGEAITAARRSLRRADHCGEPITAASRSLRPADHCGQPITAARPGCQIAGLPDCRIAGLPDPLPQGGREGRGIEQRTATLCHTPASFCHTPVSPGPTAAPPQYLTNLSNLLRYCPIPALTPLYLGIPAAPFIQLRPPFSAIPPQGLNTQGKSPGRIARVEFSRTEVVTSTGSECRIAPSPTHRTPDPRPSRESGRTRCPGGPGFYAAVPQ
jgi:hypothetical protein